MGIYIKGFKPQDGLYVIKDGVIRKYKGKGGTVRPYELVEVKEPHGRLIDADALMLTIKDNMDYFKHEGVDACADCEHSYVDDLFYEWNCKLNQ